MKDEPKLERMWVNQPSTLQPHHVLNGRRVLAASRRPTYTKVYFVDGPVISMRVASVALSPGWPGIRDDEVGG